MVKYLKKLYDKIFKTREEIEHLKKVEFFNRRTKQRIPTIKDHKPNSSN
jgi:hypothetical protein